MKFLEAQAILRRFAGGDPLPFRLIMSGTPDPLDPYLRAAAAQHGREARVQTLPFNTLQQFLRGPRDDATPEAALLMPWDLAPELDWRSGVPAEAAPAAALVESARSTATALAARAPAFAAYLPAPIPPVMPDSADQSALAAAIHSVGASLSCATLDPAAFSLGSYLASGCPIGGAALGDVAGAIIEGVVAAPLEGRYKVLVTDFDNVLWHGVVGEDGVEGVTAAPEGRGYRHYLYQTLLAALRRAGVLLVGVTRNHPDDAVAPLRGKSFPLSEDDFIAVVASYQAKSAQLRRIAGDLNLGIDSLVFVDDNPIELAEVAAELPALRCIPFPSSEDDLPAFLHELRRAFSRRDVTEVDRERTEMYRRRMESRAPVESTGAALTDFLRRLDMRLTIHDRRKGDRDRVLQLINKTNQFNLNGRRLSQAELEGFLESGASLWGATLHDRTGSHGEILACLVSADGIVESLVLSCRVFQRRVEHAFLSWLIRNGAAPRYFRFVETPRNEPIRQFLGDSAFSTVTGDGGPLVRFEAEAFQARHAGDLDLFAIDDGS